MSLEDICREHYFVLTELKEYAEVNEWTKQYEPGSAGAQKEKVEDRGESILVGLDDEEAEVMEPVDKYYITAREKLSVAATRHSMVTWEKIVNIENMLLTHAYNVLLELDELSATARASELPKIAKVLQAVKDSNKMFLEATAVPALADRSLKGESSETPEALASKIRAAIQGVYDSVSSPLDYSEEETEETEE